MLFGAHQALVKPWKKVETYQLLQPVYGLGIVADIYDPSPVWYHHYPLVKTGDIQSDVIEHLQLIFIELPKFPVQSFDEKKLRLLWLRFLREIDERTSTVSQELLDVPEISEAVQLSEEAAYTPGELNAYSDYWDAVRTAKTLLLGRYEEGKAAGREERGQEAAHDLAMSLLKSNLLPLEKIASLTGLSLKTILALQDTEIGIDKQGHDRHLFQRIFISPVRYKYGV